MDAGAKYNPLHLAHFKLLDRLESVAVRELLGLEAKQSR